MALTRLNNRSLAVDAAVTADKLDVGQLGGRRNLIINGAMQVAQRGSSFSYVNGYKLDRWLFDSYAGGSNTCVQDTDTPDSSFRNSVKITATANMSDYYFYQKVEGFRQFSGKTVTFSFYAKASQNINGMQIHWSANTGSGGDFAFMTDVETYSVTTSWQRFKFTITLPELTATETSSSYFNFFTALRQTYTNPTKGSDIPDGVSVWFTGVQVEYGSVATPFEHRSYADELALCQRYYEKIENIYFLIDNNSLDHTHSYTFMVQKRATPSLTNNVTMDNGGTAQNPYTTTSKFSLSNSVSGRNWFGTVIADSEL